MDPVSPVAQLAVAAISGAAFLISVLVIPFPEAKVDPASGFSAASGPTSTSATFQPADNPFSPSLK